MAIRISALALALMLCARAAAGETYDLVWSSDSSILPLANIIISPGDSVQWTWSFPSGIECNLLSGSNGNWDGLFGTTDFYNSNFTYSFTFMLPGIFPYFCSNSSVSATIEVEGLILDSLVRTQFTQAFPWNRAAACQLTLLP